jgi:hypothetical protein
MANPNPDQRGLTPIRSGQVLNPSGRNQYTYRDEAERSLDKWCKKHGDDVIERLVTDAKNGKGYAMRLVLDRILPQVNKHEVELPGTDAAGLIAAVERAAKKSGR